MGILLFLTACPYGVRAQELDVCAKEAALLSPTEPIYPDAMELKRTLENHGFVVYCVFPTTLWSVFWVGDGDDRFTHSTVEGEANFHTNYGDATAFFLPKPQTFANFKITEHREDGGFLYTFAGTPRVWATNRFGSARRIYFLDHDNQLFFVGDVTLLHRLEKVLNARHRRL
ncbi:MAG: hypothetical protein WBS24_08155 [Terriglobales bacterium]